MVQRQANNLIKKSLREILKISDISIQVGGGIRSIEKIENMLKMGVSRVIVGTAIFNGEFFNRSRKKL